MMILLTILLIISITVNIFIFRILMFSLKENEKLVKNRMKNSEKMFEYIDRLRIKNKILESEEIIDKKELKEIIKFAMLQAHPDNPKGNKDKFIRYKELYDKL